MKFSTVLCVLFLFWALPCGAEPDFPVPPGFVLQHLDPTDGRVAKPKDWHYSSGGTSSGWLWTISAEDPEDYETGLRIQLIVDVKGKASKNPSEFIAGFLDRKKKTTKTLSECTPAQQGDFERRCLEVTEEIKSASGTKSYRIQYSTFSSDKMNMAILTTFGTPEQNWEKFAETSRVMSHVEVIGPNFGKKDR